MTVLKRVFMPAATVFATIALLTACGGTEEEPAAPASEPSAEESAEFNEADVTFARMMIPHHEQAVTMAELAQGRAGEEVRALAEEIQAAQGPEIDQLNALLESWAQEPAQDMEGMDHDGMTGMMSEEQMAELEAAEGEEFDTMFLQMMIEHHEGAVETAQTELDEGTNPEVRELAQQVIDAQRAEIEQMNEMLGAEGQDSGDDDGVSPSEEDHGGR
ncbi:DUF305 domain-containing protein [Nocardiopsis sp. TSRI0078]|uniref:DUF305 domain-containing protein n=1 Tax=unclassified Nocardiopsis TaxID=2649073 RepID=UPI00093A5448|nr:DUF305 domain-containing protein [Nocardiopsis sp. TSRI0078]OKI20240.1 DUF305 domain-containing protein [Nocardiopsis sp. TSRI0078]